MEPVQTLSKEEWELEGRILLHEFLLCLYIPVTLKQCPS